LPPNFQAWFGTHENQENLNDWMSADIKPACRLHQCGEKIAVEETRPHKKSLDFLLMTVSGIKYKELLYEVKKWH